MTSHKLSTIVYAQGYIEDYIESTAVSIEPGDSFTDDQIAETIDQNEHHEQVLAMWKVLSEGLDQLRKENTSLQNKLALIDLARNTET